MKMNESTKSLLFLAVMSLIVGNVLAGVHSLFNEGIEKNRKMLEVRSLLSVLQVPDTEDLADDPLLSLFDEKVTKKGADGEMAIYEYRENGQLEAIAFEVGGRGLWDRIKGYVAVEADGRTIRAINFYEQKETAGLGGEIGTPMFANRFVGKKLKQGDSYLKIVKSGTVSELSDTQVNGITGATLTGDAINVFMEPQIEAFLATR